MPCHVVDCEADVAQGILEEVNLLQEMTEACRACVRAFVNDRTDPQGRVSIDSFANFARNLGFQKQPWEEALKVFSIEAFQALLG